MFNFVICAGLLYRVDTGKRNERLQSEQAERREASYDSRYNQTAITERTSTANRRYS